MWCGQCSSRSDSNQSNSMWQTSNQNLLILKASCMATIEEAQRPTKHWMNAFTVLLRKQCVQPCSTSSQICEATNMRFTQQLQCIQVEPGQAGWRKFRVEPGQAGWRKFREREEPIKARESLYEQRLTPWLARLSAAWSLGSLCPWHFLLSTSLSDAATFSWSGLLLTFLNPDGPSCRQLWSQWLDTLFSPDKLFLLSCCLLKPMSFQPLSVDVSFSWHPYLWASLFLETFFCWHSLLSTSHSLDTVFVFLVSCCFRLLFWDLFLLKMFDLTPSVLTSPLSWGHCLFSHFFLLTSSYLAKQNHPV